MYICCAGSEPWNFSLNPGSEGGTRSETSGSGNVVSFHSGGTTYPIILCSVNLQWFQAPHPHPQWILQPGGAGGGGLRCYLAWRHASCVGLRLSEDMDQWRSWEAVQHELNGGFSGWGGYGGPWRPEFVAAFLWRLRLHGSLVSLIQPPSPPPSIHLAAYAGWAAPPGILGRAPATQTNGEITRKSAILLTSCWIIKYRISKCIFFFQSAQTSGTLKYWGNKAVCGPGGVNLIRTAFTLLLLFCVRSLARCENRRGG